MKKRKLLAAAAAAVLAVVLGIWTSAEEMPEVFEEETAVTAESIACGDFTYTVNSDGTTATITGYSGTGGDVVIPGEVDGYTVDAIGNRAFAYSNITGVVIPDGIVEIGYDAFSGCKSLVNVVLPEGLQAIHSDAFSWCSALAYIKIPASVVSMERSVFDFCQLLRTAGPIGGGYNIEFGWTTEIPDDAFYASSSLEEIVIPEGVTTIGSRAFENCTGITHMVVPDSLQTIGKLAFSGCTGITTAGPVGGGYNMEFGWTNIPKNSFTDLTELEYLVIPGSVKSLEYGYLMNNEKLLTAGPIGGGYDIEYGWETMIPSYAFTTIYLEEIEFPGRLTEICTYAFYGCDSLKKLVFPESLTTFHTKSIVCCYNLEKVIIPCRNVVFKYTYHAFFEVCPKLMTFGPIGGGYNIEVGWESQIPSSMFYGCDELVLAVIPLTVTRIDDYTFAHCNSLMSVDLPDNLTSIGDRSFVACDSLESIQFPNTLVKIGESAFYECGSLIDAYFSGRAPEFGVGTVFPTDTILYYLQGAPGWTDSEFYNKETGKWRGYTIAPYGYVDTSDFVPTAVKPKSTDITGEDEECVIQVYEIDLTGESEEIQYLFGASVTLGSVTKTTGGTGMVKFPMPEDETVTLKITKEDYIGVEYSGYAPSSYDLIGLQPKEEKNLVPVMCNATDLSTGTAQINNKADLTATIVVKGESTVYPIEKIVLMQGNTVLDEDINGVFHVHNSNFKEDVAIMAAMYTSDGVITKQSLRIDVVSQGLLSLPDLLSGALDIVLPDDVEYLGGMKVNLRVDKMNMETRLSNEDMRLGINVAVWEKDLQQVEKALKNLMKDAKMTTPSASFKVKVGGYFIVKFDENGLYNPIMQLVLAGEYKNSVGQTIPVSAITVRLEVDLSVKGEVRITSVEIDAENNQINYPNKIDLSVTGEGTGRAGVGNSVMSAGFYGKPSLTFYFNLRPEMRLKYIRLMGEFGLYAKAEVFHMKLQSDVALFGGTKLIYGTDDSDETAQTALTAALYDASQYEYADREYLSLASHWNPTSDGVLQSGVYDSADPQIVTTDTVTMMAFLNDNGGGDEYNFQELVYSIWTDSGWSAPIPVDDNALIDASFRLYTDGADIWIVYMQSNRAFTAEDDTYACAGAMEIAAAKYDSETGVFGESAILTANDTYDMQPDMTVVDGIPTIVWVNNGDNHLFGMTENNSIMMSRFVDGAWTIPSVLAENVHAVTGLAAGSLDGTTLSAAVIHDADSDFNTTGDSTLVLYQEAGASRNVSSGSSTDSSPESVVFEGNTLYWYAGNAIYSMDSKGEAAVTDTLSSDSASDFDVAEADGKKYIFFRVYNTEGENGGSDIYVMTGTDGTWTEPVRLTKTEGYVDSYDAAVLDGKLLTVFRRTDVTFAEDSMTTVSALHAASIAPAVSLEIVSVDYDSDDLFGDDTVTLTVGVRNNGTIPASGFCAAAGEGQRADYTDAIESGETVEIQVVCTMSGEGETADVSVTDENGVTDTETIQIRFADFTAEAKALLISDQPYLNVTVRNAGSLAGNGIVNIRRESAEGDIVYSDKVTLEAGEQKYSLIKILDDTLERVYVEMIPDGDDYFTGDNNTATSIYRAERDSLDLNRDGQVNMADAAALKESIDAGEAVDEAYDFDASGTIDEADAAYFAWSFVKPETYPIQ